MLIKISKVIFLMLLLSCTNKERRYGNSRSAKYDNSVSTKDDLMDVDKQFSNLCKEKGMKNAFMEYIDSNGVLLRPNEPLLVGADAIDYLIQQNDSSYTLEWEPENATISTSGDLGFTYGYYKLTPSDKDTVLQGTYVSIWKRQANGEWKFLLDTGNEGIGN